MDRTVRGAEPGVVGGRLCEQSTRMNIPRYTGKVGVS